MRGCSAPRLLYRHHTSEYPDGALNNCFNRGNGLAVGFSWRPILRRELRDSRAHGEEGPLMAMAADSDACSVGRTTDERAHTAEGGVPPLRKVPSSPIIPLARGGEGIMYGTTIHYFGVLRT